LIAPASCRAATKGEGCDRAQLTYRADVKPAISTAGYAGGVAEDLPDFPDGRPDRLPANLLRG
jgi:hypothetical protein